MKNYEYYELDDYVDPNSDEQIYIREAGREMQMDDLEEKIKAMEEEIKKEIKNQLKGENNVNN